MRTSDDEALVRELEAIYADIEADFRRGDLDAVAARLTPDFVARAADGAVVQRDEVLAGFREMMANMADIAWPRSITKIEQDGDDVVVTAEGRFSGTTQGADGKPTRLEQDTLAADTWVRTGGAWRTRAARSLRS